MDGFNSSFIDNKLIPLVLESAKLGSSKNDFFHLLESNKEELKKNLSHYGALLFRGFPLEGTGDFTQAIHSLGLGKFVDYIGGDSPRNKLNEGVYTSTEAPPSLKIPLHNELSFVKYYPKNIYFFCEVAPKEKGETIIADARKVLNSIRPEIRNRFVQKGLRYVSCYYYKSRTMEFLNKLQPSHKSWIHVFETDSKKEVEKKCLENEFEFQWLKNDWLQITQNRPAIMPHPETAEEVWFNQAHLYDFNPRLLGRWRYIGAKLFYCRKYTRLHEIYYGDNTTISRSDLYNVLDALDSQTIAFPWKKGDLLVLDNVLTMHGRATFQGKRRILTAMTS